MLAIWKWMGLLPRTLSFAAAMWPCRMLTIGFVGSAAVSVARHEDMDAMEVLSAFVSTSFGAVVSVFAGVGVVVVGGGDGGRLVPDGDEAADDVGVDEALAGWRGLLLPLPEEVPPLW